MIVLDSSFLIAFHNTRDVHHGAAAELMDRFLDGEWGSGLLLEYIFLEVVTVLASRRDLEVASTVGDALLEAEELQFVPCSELFLDAYSTLRDQEHGELSLADAAIVTLARQWSIPHVATFDDDFRDLEGVSVVPV